METQLNLLLSLSVISVIEIHDYLQIVFSDGVILNIFNRYFYGDPKADTVSDLVGKIVIDVTQNQQNICIVFSDRSELVIGLSNDDYNGAEALEIRKGESIIIWS